MIHALCIGLAGALSVVASGLNTINRGITRVCRRLLKIAADREH